MAYQFPAKALAQVTERGSGKRPVSHAAFVAGQPCLANRLRADDPCVNGPQIASSPGTRAELGNHEKWIEIRHLGNAMLYQTTNLEYLKTLNVAGAEKKGQLWLAPGSTDKLISG